MIKYIIVIWDGLCWNEADGLGSMYSTRYDELAEATKALDKLREIYARIYTRREFQIAEVRLLNY